MVPRAGAENRPAGRPANSRPYLPYLAAAALVLAAAVVRALLPQTPGTLISVMMFYPAVLLAAFSGGLPAGLLAALLSAFPAFFLRTGPDGHLVVAPPLAWPDTALFLIGGAMIAGTAEALYRRRLGAETARGGGKEENEHLASFPRLNPNPVIELDSRGEVTFHNEAALQILRELGAQEDIRLFYPADLEEIIALLHAGKTDTQIPFREVRIKDRTFWENIYPLKKLGVLRMYVTDVTKQKRAEEELHESEKRLLQALDAGGMGSWGLDAQTGEAWRSLRHDQIFGYDTLLPDRSYRRFLDHILPEDRGPMEETFGQALATGAEWQYECRIRRADGAVRWIRAQGKPRVNDQNEVVWMVGLVEDITDLKRAEEELKKAHDELELRVRERTAQVREQTGQLESFFRHTQTCMAFLDPNFNFIRVNEAYARVTGRDVSDFVGHNHFTDYPSEELRGKFTQVVETKQPYHVLGRPFTFPDHPERGVTYWDLSVAPILDESREVAFLAFSLLDVTERKQAEEKIARLNRLYSVRSQVNEAILRSSDAETLYWEICRIAVEDGSFKMAWIGLLDPEKRRITPFISYGDAGGYLQDDVRIFAADVPEGRGPTGRAILEKTYCVCGDIAQDPRMAPWRDRALTQGFRSAAAFPLFAGSTVIGAFTFYSDKPQVFTDEETGLLDALVEDVSFAVDALVSEQERRKAEEALHRANAYNRSLIEASLDPLVTIDAGGKITDVNAATETMTGLPRTALIGTDFSDYFTRPEDARAGYRQVFRDGSVRDYALEILHTDGHATPVLYNASLYRSEAGEVIGVFAAARDVTERRKAEEITRQDERRNERILRISQHRAASLQELLDLTLAEAITFMESPLGFLYHYNEDTREFTLHAWSKNVMQQCTVINPRTVYRLEKTGIWGEVVRQRRPMTINDFAAPHPLKKGYPEGHVALSRFSGIPIFSSGRIVAVVGVANKPADYTDEDVRQLALLMDAIWKIIERRKAEEEVHTLNEELEQRVAERTRQLEVTNRELESFSYSVSHDLRAPLRAIDGFSRRILIDYDTRLDAEGKRLLGVIRKNTQGMGQLIDELLAFSRLGKQELRSSEIDMAGLAEKVYHEVKSSAAAGRAVTFALQDPPRAYADPTLIRQVLMNLLSNAVKFTRQTGNAVIEFGGSVEENEYVYFLRDNGIGFDMRYADKLFGVFQRLHGETEFEGTGVGLAIVQRIIARHGGRVWAEGKVDGGAVFYFTLPH